MGMPSIFRDLLGMNGYMYKETDGKHHQKHFHVKVGDTWIALGFDGTILSGDASKLSKKQKKALSQSATPRLKPGACLEQALAD